MHEARRFLEILDGDRLKALFVLTLSLGLRLGEEFGLSWADLNFENSRITIRHNLEKVTNQPFRLVETKSDNGFRSLVLPSVAAVLPQRHRGMQQRDRELAGSHWQDNDWDLVFTSTADTPLFHRNVHRHFWDLLDRGGLRRIRPHDMRHSAAALLIAPGVHPKAIQELLGHSSVAFTLQVSGHLFEEAKQETADKMDEVLKPVAASMAANDTIRRVN